VIALPFFPFAAAYFCSHLFPVCQILAKGSL
jgi:hypothetical protein